jgi:hypothetical protein
MLKKFIRTLIVLAFLFVENSAMGSSAPKGWLDESGHSAPSTVRAAADQLWRAVEIEGSAAFDANYGLIQKPSCDCNRFCIVFSTCGLSELCDCWYPCCNGQGCTSNFGRIQYYEGGLRAEGVIFEHRTKEMKEVLENFKTLVNSSVSSPVGYQGDAEICDIGPWIADHGWTKHSGRLSSVRRDLRSVQGSTMSFVNKHGGWKQ